VVLRPEHHLLLGVARELGRGVFTVTAVERFPVPGVQLVEDLRWLGGDQVLADEKLQMLGTGQRCVVGPGAEDEVEEGDVGDPDAELVS
jgi:hypothetical protein